LHCGKAFPKEVNLDDLCNESIELYAATSYSRDPSLRNVITLDEEMRPERRRKLSSEGAGADIETPHAKRDPATMSMVDNLSIGSSSQKQSSSWKKSVYKAFRSLTGSRSPSIQHPPDLTEDKERDSITRDPEVLNKLQFGSVQGSASLRAETTDIFVPMKKLILPGGNHSTALGFSYYKRIRVILHTQLLGIDRSQLNLFTNFALTH